MKTKLVRPVLVTTNDIDAKLTMYHNGYRNQDGSFDYCELSTNLDHLQYHTNQQLLLISLDPDEKIEVGDALLLDNEIVTCIGFGLTKDAIKIKCKIEPFIHKSHFKKVIATQDQLSPDLINQLVAEYNNGGMRDFEIEMEISVKKDGIQELMTDEFYQKFPEELPNCVFLYKPKLTNGFVTVEYPLFGISNNPNINGIDYENTPIPDYPIVYIEEEVKALINKAIFDTVGNPMLITSELKINNVWFNKNKKK